MLPCGNVFRAVRPGLPLSGAGKAFAMMDNQPYDFDNLPGGEEYAPPVSNNELLNRLLSEDSSPAPESKQPSQSPEELPPVELPSEELPSEDHSPVEQSPSKQPSAEQPTEPEPLDEEPDDRPEEKPRSGIGCLSSFTYCILIFGVSILLTALLILAANDMFALVKSDQEITIAITDDDSLRDIADTLSDNGIIRYPSLFWTFAKMTDMDDRIQSGTYTLSPSMDYRSILSAIRYRPNTRQVVTVTIPEGMTQDDIFELLEENGVCEAYLLRAYAKYYDFSYSFLKDLPYSDKRLEGYLFPDTYDFYIDDSPVRVLKKFLSNFSRKWDVDLKSRAENINMSIRDITIIASMIEREAKYDEERPVIASVIHNRLRSSRFPHLQIDATVQYALPEWKEYLTEEDLKIDSPYNTYLCEGLPIGPICNPGLAAIRAVLYPEDTNYYYYVARKNGWHYFASTYDQHQENIRRASEEDLSTPGDAS